LLSKALRVITYLPSVATSAVKEFIYDPIAYLVTPGTTDKVSIKEFMDNVNKRNFAAQQYSFLKYDEKAPLWEKFLKEAGGFGVDVLSTGGFGGGVNFLTFIVGNGDGTLSSGSSSYISIGWTFLGGLVTILF
jgi:hypothetical protein